MKRYYLLFLLIAFISCKKQGASPSISIIGKWELRSETGGWSGTHTYPKGNGNIYLFTTRQYQIYVGGKLQKQGTYALTKKTSMLQNKLVDAVVFDDQTDTPITVVELLGDQLFLSIDAYDANSDAYERVE